MARPLDRARDRSEVGLGRSIDAPTGAWRVTGTVPFSSARKWSAVAFTGEAPGTYVFGAPEVILAEVGADDPVRRRADELAATGRRVLLLAFSPDELAGEELPDAISPMSLVTLSERIRADAPETLAYFREQGAAVGQAPNPAGTGGCTIEIGASVVIDS